MARWIGRLLIARPLGLLALWEYAWHTARAVPVRIKDDMVINNNGAIRPLLLIAPVMLAFAAVNTIAIGFSLRSFNRQLSTAKS
jgi:hypothetical protein